MKAAIPPTSEPQTRSRHILVVDDDCDDSSFITEALRELDPACRVSCIDRSETLENFLTGEEKLPDLIILDYNMPVRNGYELLCFLKAHPRFAAVPVAMYSHSSYPKHKAECLDAGACAYFTKPNSLAEIREDVRRMLVLTNQFG